MNHLFEEIDKEKKAFPEMKVMKHHFTEKRTFNFYQIVAIVLLAIGFIGGILLGNMIPSCTATNFYQQCTMTEFNISLTLLTWGGVFLFSLFLYSIGHIIQVLESIDRKMK